MIEPGMLLVAHPDLKDPMFSKSVVLITEVNESGVIGYIMNKSSETHMRKAVEGQITDDWPWDETLHRGGPVKSLALIMIHSSEWTSTSTYHINDELAMSSDRLMIEKLVDGDVPIYRRFLNCSSGWKQEQLMKEIYQQNQWLTCKSSHTILFEKTGISQWKDAIEHCARETMTKFF